MKIPGYWWSAVILGLVAGIQALIPGIEGNVDALLAPVLVALLAAGAAALDKLRNDPPDFVARSVEERGFWGRFWLGD